MRDGEQRRGVRASALWGSGKRRAAVFATLALAVLVPIGAAASPSKQDVSAYVTPSLLSAVQANATGTFSVIVQGKAGNQAAKAVADVLGTQLKAVRNLNSIDGVAVDLTGAQVLALAADKHVSAVTLDARVRLSSASAPDSSEKWPYVTGVNKYAAAPAATIAIVDSGIDATRPEFAGRIAANVNLSTLPGNSPGDGRGHGTFVAGIAAGHLAGKDGAAPTARLVSIDVMDDQGMARTSDVIAAADWILANKTKYGIRVANFSLHSSVANSFMYDPLDKAVERLWFNGVVVVAAAGNYGYPDRPSGVPFAPGNDPFVITVGASDTGKSVATNDDVAAPWSAYGYTLDGFAKPDLAAPGRYIVGPVPVTSTLYSERPEHIVEPGYEPEQGPGQVHRRRSRHGRPGLRLGQLGRAGEERRLLGEHLLGFRLVGGRVVVVGQLGRGLLERRQLGVCVLGVERLGDGLLGRPEPRERLLGRQRRGRVGGRERRRDRPARARRHPRRHARPLGPCDSSRFHPFGGTDRVIPDRGMPTSGGDRTFRPGLRSCGPASRRRDPCSECGANRYLARR